MRASWLDRDYLQCVDNCSEILGHIALPSTMLTVWLRLSGGLFNLLSSVDEPKFTAIRAVAQHAVRQPPEKLWQDEKVHWLTRGFPKESYEKKTT